MSTLSTKLTTSPIRTAPNTDVKFSKMCASGRYEITSSASLNGMTRIRDSTAQRMFWCDSIAPLGGPVVPDV